MPLVLPGSISVSRTKTYFIGESRQDGLFRLGRVLFSHSDETVHRDGEKAEAKVPDARVQALDLPSHVRLLGDAVEMMMYL